MKNAKKVFNGWFFGWLGLSVVLVIAMFIAGPNLYKSLSSTIMAFFFLMPMRDWSYRFMEWAIEYVASIDAVFKDRVNKWVTTNNMIEPNKRFENIGHYRTLKVAINVIMLTLALTAMVFQSVSFNIVYAWLHTIECIFTGRIKFWMMLVELVSTIIFAYWAIRFIGKILNETFLDDDGKLSKEGKKAIAIAIIIFYVKLIVSSILLRYTASMTFSRIMFWTVIVAIPVIVLTLIELFSKKAEPLDGGSDDDSGEILDSDDDSDDDSYADGDDDSDDDSYADGDDDSDDDSYADGDDDSDDDSYADGDDDSDTDD